MQVLEARPQGIRWAEPLRAVEATAPDTPHNSVHGGVANLLTTRRAVHLGRAGEEGRTSDRC